MKSSSAAAGSAASRRRCTPEASTSSNGLVLLPSLPPLRIPVLREQRPPIIIYTDAMFRPGTPPRVAHVGGMEIHYAGSPPYSRAAFVVWDPLLQIFMHSDRVLPPAFYESLTGDDNTYILQAELIAGIAAYSSLPHIVRGRPVVHFIDNTGALSLLVHGYASRPDCARLVNVFHLLQARLRFRAWFEWVPSAANISDLPSRGAYDEYFAAVPGSLRVPFTLPNFSTFTGPLADLLLAFEDFFFF